MRMIIDKVLSFIEENKLSKHLVEKRSGLSNAYLANIKKTNSEIQPDKLAQIIEEFPELESYLESKKSMLVPLISLEAAAGFGNTNFAITKEDIQAEYLVPDFNGIDFMIRVKGSSMYPKYSSGDVVACRIIHEVRFIQWNKPYVIATREQGLLCKRLMPSKKKGYYQIVSDNQAFPPFDIPQSEITGYALIVGVIRLE